MDRYILIILLLVWTVSSRPIEDFTEEGTHDGRNSDGVIVRSVIGQASSLEYRLGKWKKLKFYIDSSKFPDPAKVLNARLYLYREPTRGKHQGPKDAEVVLLQNQRGRDAIVALGKVSTDTVGWLNFDVTNTVQHWIRKPNSNKGLDVWLQMFEHKGHQKKAISFRGPRKYSATKPTLVIRYNTSDSTDAVTEGI